jgi:hypothetical protein
MVRSRFVVGGILAILTALAVGGCMRQEPAYYVVDPATGRPVPVVSQQQFSQPQYSQQAYDQPHYAQQPYQQPATQPRAAARGERGFFTAPDSAPQAYAQQTYAQAAAQPQPASTGERGLFNSQHGRPLAYAASAAIPSGNGGPYAAAPYGYAYPPQTGDSAAARFRWY